MYKSKYKSRVDKVKAIGILKENNLSEYEARETLSNILNKTIMKKKPIDFDILSTSDIEPVLKAIERKYGMYIGYILPLRKEIKECRVAYSFSLRLNSDNIDTIYARTIFEGMCKSLIVLYYYTKLKGDELSE